MALALACVGAGLAVSRCRSCGLKQVGPGLGARHKVACSTVLRKTKATLSGLLCVRNSRQTLPGARSPSPHSRGAACHASRGNCVPEIMRKVGCGFRLRARWKTASHFGYKFRDALSAEVLNRKLHPIPKANSGTHLPQPHPSGKPFHPESPSHSEYIQRTYASVLSRTASSSG